jgi:SAM-dependent methyltransferase
MFHDASAYDRFMGRYSRGLAAQMADLAGVHPGQKVLDVGAGTGVLTDELVGRVGVANVTAAEPSAGFVAMLRSRFPGLAVEQSGAENLPFTDAEFDATLAQLVVHFMSDPVAGIRQMRRVTRGGGVVAACVWDDAGSPLNLFWRAAHTVDLAASDESTLPGTHEGELARLFDAAGLVDVHPAELSVRVRHDSFDEWWAPYEGGTGPAGRYVASLDADARVALREAARSLVPGVPFEISGRAWAARGVVPA